MTSRRSFLAAVGAASVTAVGAGAVQEDVQTTYRFGGEVAGWMGRAPQSISGQTNPTIELQAGTEYEVVWENLDGVPHNFTIQDAEGNEIASTETMSEEGATRSLTFTASEEMAQYICTIHPSSMVGDIEIVSGQTPTGTPTGTATPGQQGYVPAGPDIGLQRVADGPLVNPTGLHPVPGEEDTRLILDQMGQIYVHDGDGLDEEPILDIRERLSVLTEAEGGFPRPEGFDERGLLGLAFHPDFENNRLAYLRYSGEDALADDGLIGPPGRDMPENWDHVEVLAEIQVPSDLSRIDPESERILLEVPEPQFNHNSGDLAFGPDGYLYVGLGDGGGADDTGIGHVQDWYEANDGGNGQDLDANLLGSLLRIDVDDQEDGKPYAVPDDNPLTDVDGAYDEQYAWGFRNPWRFSFNDGTLIVADVGQNLYEEVDVVERGGNYGWNVKEGPFCFSTEHPSEPADQCPDRTPQDDRGGEPLIDPVLWYPHTFQGQSVGISVTGGYVYRGDAVPALQGRYIFGDWSQSFVQPAGRLFVGDVTDRQNSGTPTGTETATPTETESGMGSPTPTPTETETGMGTPTPTETEAEQQAPVDREQASFEELMVTDAEGNAINRFISSFGRGADGEIYVLVSRTGRLGQGTPGEVWLIVPPGEGERISQPEIETPTPSDGDDDGDGGKGGTPTPTETGTPTG